MTLLALATAWLAGVYLGVGLETPAPALGLFVVASGLLAALLATVRRSPLPALLLAALALGALRAALLTGDPGSELTRFHGVDRVLVEGVVVADPEAAGSAIRLRLTVDRIRHEAEWVDTSGDVLATLRESAELAGQRERPYFRYGGPAGAGGGRRRAARLRGVRLRGLPGAPWNRVGDVLSRRHACRRRRWRLRLSVALRRPPEHGRLAGAGGARAAGLAGPGPATGH